MIPHRCEICGRWMWRPGGIITDRRHYACSEEHVHDLIERLVDRPEAK